MPSSNPHLLASHLSTARPSLCDQDVHAGHPQEGPPCLGRDLQRNRGRGSVAEGDNGQVDPEPQVTIKKNIEIASLGMGAECCGLVFSFLQLTQFVK